MKKTILSCLLICFTCMPIAFTAVTSADLLEQVIEPSKQNNQIIDMGNNKNSVGNAVFKQSVDIITGKVKQPLYIRIIKVILRAILIVGVSMGIVIGIKYVYSQWDEGAQKKLQGYLWNIVYWILIALGSLTIVEIIQSITNSSVNF